MNLIELVAYRNNYEKDLAVKYFQAQNYSVSVLNLATKTEKTLGVMGCTEIKDLPHFDYMKFAEFRGIGRRYISDLISKWAKLSDPVIKAIKQGILTEENCQDIPLASLLDKMNENSSFEIEKVINSINGESASGPSEDDTHKSVINRPIEALGLSVRAYNVLKRMHIDSLSQMLTLSDEDLLAARNCGIKTVDEIRRVIASAKTTTVFTAGEGEPEPEESFETITEEQITDYWKAHDKNIRMLGFSVRAANVLKSLHIDRISQLISLTDEKLFEARNCGKKTVDEIMGAVVSAKENAVSVLTNGESGDDHSSISKEELLAIIVESIAESRDGILSLSELLHIVQDRMDPEQVQQYLEEYIKAGKICVDDEDKYSLPVPTFEEVVNKYLDEKERDILFERLNGKTFQEICQHYGVSRERVRQIQSRAIRKVRYALLKNYNVYNFEEDEYKYLYTNYDLNKEVWLDYLNVPKRTLNYLTIRYDHGSGTAIEAEDDDRITVEQRKAIQKYNKRDFIIEGDSFIPRIRTSIENYIFRTFCRDEIDIDTFLELYREFIEKHDLTNDDRLTFTEAQYRSRYNRIAENEYILYSPGRKFRYYDRNAYDFSELLETLQLENYEDTELSTNKWFITYPELMKKYDIRSCYELHNLLKKLFGDNTEHGIQFSRNPMVFFGHPDRKKAVTDLLFELAPVSKDGLIQAIVEEYGIDPGTAAANWTSYVSEYQTGDYYYVDYEAISDEELHVLDRLLTDDFYFIQDIRKFYLKLFPNADDSSISKYNLSRLGFKTYCNYAVRNYKSASKYFENLLTSGDIVDYKMYAIKYASIWDFWSTLNGLKDTFDVIEFEPYSLIRLSKLEEQGISRQMLKDYCGEVYEFAGDEYFTLQWIRNRGFVSMLDNLGFDDFFYNSLLKEEERFSHQRIGGTVVFRKGTEPVVMSDFFEHIVKLSGGIELDDMVRRLEDNYGILMTRRYKIVSAIENTDVYYDKIMDKLYPSYDVYYEEI